MIIKGSSWHYKYIAHRWDSDPNGLCWYFWKIIISMLLIAAISTGGVLLALGAVWFVLFPIWQWFFDYTPKMQAGVALLWFVIGVAVAARYRMYLYDTDVLQRKKKVYKEPGLVSQYLHAKHRKVCPRLKYKRSE